MKIEGWGSKLAQKNLQLTSSAYHIFQNQAHTFIEDHMLIISLEFVHPTCLLKTTQLLETLEYLSCRHFQCRLKLHHFEYLHKVITLLMLMEKSLPFVLFRML